MPKSGPRDLTTFIADLRDSKLTMSTKYLALLLIVRGKMTGGLSHTLHEGQWQNDRIDGGNATFTW